MNQVNSTHPGNPINTVGQKTPGRHSSFNNKYKLFMTARFGEITPHFAAETVPSDHFTLQCAHDVNTFTLKAPLMQPVRMKKDYFHVPLTCILPNTAEKIYNNPVQGDDVPDDAICGLKLFDLQSKMSTLSSAVLTRLNNLSYYNSHAKLDDNAETFGKALTYFFNQIVLWEYLYSDGSLCNYLGLGLPSYSISDASGVVNRTIDDFLEEFITWLKSFATGFAFERGSDMLTGYAPKYMCILDPDATIPAMYLGYKDNKVSLREFLEMLRDDGGCHIDGILNYEALEKFTDPDDPSTGDGGYDALSTLESAYLSMYNFSTVLPIATDPTFVNWSRVAAYQIACAHFYTNDHVDYIYSAELYRQNLKSLARQHDISGKTPLNTWPTFSWNGLNIEYDALSGYVLFAILDGLREASYQTFYAGTNQAIIYYSLRGYIANLFGYRHSLRFMDYFTGSKTRPLAVGDTGVPVVGAEVDVVDVTRQIQVQRFLNAVNRTGRKLSNYIQTLFGVSPSYDFHDPRFLGSTEDVIFGRDTQNTGDAQLTDKMPVTSRLQSNASKFAFEFDCSMPGVVIGLTSFDIERSYADACDRSTFARDRFDMFNPFLEYIGDQPIYLRELDRNLPDSNPFGYQTRYMEYKQRINRVVGGFVNELPGYAFIADRVNSLLQVNPIFRNLGPSYIRSTPRELDEFYVSLTGNALTNYFHFIILSDNYLDTNRPMAATPQIL